MKNVSTLSKALMMTLGIAIAGTAAIAAGQTTSSNAQMSEAMAATQSKIGLSQAIAISQKAVKGDVISAEFDQHKHSATGKYEVKTIANNIEYEIDIDANTGKVLKSKKQKLDKEDVAEYRTMKQAKTTLTQAMQKAAQNIGGKVIEAEFDIDNGQAVYELKATKGNQLYKVVIDSMTGKVISSHLDNDD